MKINDYLYSKYELMYKEKFENILEQKIMFSIHCIVYNRDLFLNVLFVF